ncbi:MAG TPA: hypothetical protein VGJ57_03875 [Nitrospirales bacterium]
MNKLLQNHEGVRLGRESLIVLGMLLCIQSTPSFATEVSRTSQENLAPDVQVTAGEGNHGEVQSSKTPQTGLKEDAPTEEGQGVESRAVGQPLPLMMPKLQRTIAPQTWDVLWAVTWKRASSYYRIQAAPTTQQDSMCRSNLMLDVLVHDTIQAIAMKKYGDAARFMSQFQDRSLCLTREGMRGVDFALSFYLHHALTHLPPAQAHIAVQGVLNLGMLTFDQLQYTRRSWWLLTVMSHAQLISPQMSDYPRNDLGLWLYDSAHGIMARNRFSDGLDRLVGAMRRIENFGRGTCTLVDMSETGFVCQDDLSGSGLTKGGTGSSGKLGQFPVMPGTLPPNTASCMLQSVQATGVRGTLACVSKAMAGFTFNPRTGLQDTTIPSDEQSGIRDKMCALGQEAQAGDGTTPSEKATEQKEPSTWDKIKSGAKDAADKVWSVVTAVFEKTPPVVSELEPAASPQGADAERGFLQSMQEYKARESLLKDEGAQEYEKQRDQRVVTDPQADKGRLAGDGSGGGKCSARSNAAARAQTLFQCMAKPDNPSANPGTAPLSAGNQQASPENKQVGGSTKTIETTSTNMGGNTKLQGGKSPVLDPNLIHVDPSIDSIPGTQPGGSISGPLSCMVEAGDLIRTSLNDPRCDARMRCVGDQPCPCNRQSAVMGGPPSVTQDPHATPDCIDGKCDGPRISGTPNPTPKPNANFGGPPAPPPR